MKKLNKKGFTLAELLIVVAIIAVLTAIAIPVFKGAVDKAAVAADAANIRAAYAELQVEEIAGSDVTGTRSTKTFTAQSGASTTADSSVLQIGTNGAKADLPAAASSAVTLTKGKTVTVTMSGGKISLAVAN